MTTRGVEDNNVNVISNGDKMLAPKSNGNSVGKNNLESELELILVRQQQHNRYLAASERERDLNISRSGSAPPTIQGSSSAVGSLFRNSNLAAHSSTSVNNSSSGAAILTEEEIRSHPAYLAYYYSNVNLNPRLPPPLLSREDWRVAQRVQAGGFEGWRNKNSGEQGGGNSSLFAMQPGFPVQRAEDEMIKLRKAAARNLLRGNAHTELLESSSGIGSRKKSFADIVQEGLDQPAHLPADLSHSNPEPAEALHTGKAPPGFSGVEKNQNSKPFYPNSSTSAISSSVRRSRTPELHPSPNSSSSNGHSSGMTEVSDLATSLAHFHYDDNMRQPWLQHRTSNGHHLQNLQHQLVDHSRTEKLATPADFADLMRNNGGLVDHNSTFYLDGHTHSPRTSEYASEEDRKVHRQVENYPKFDSTEYIPVAYQYNQKLNMAFNRNPSKGRNVAGASHGNADLKGSGMLHAEMLFPQQKQQYHSPYLRNSCNLRDGNSVNHALGSGIPCQESKTNPMHVTVGSVRSPTFQSDPLHQIAPVIGNSTDEPTSSSLLEDLKNNPRSLDLLDVLNHVVKFSKDQYGSRFIQKKLETATVEEKVKIFPEILPHAHSLMTDVFGNYVIQKFLEHGTESQRKELGKQVIGHVLPLSLQMYGCRVIQKALEIFDVELQAQMVKELDGNVMKCVRDQNGNHVIQKCIEHVPQDRIHFILTSFFGQVVSLSTHPYGCRVIQRVLEYCDDPEVQKIIMDEIMQTVGTLVLDQYGNYVIQHVLQHGKPSERADIIGKLTGQIVKMSQHKYASNVVEKCLVFATPEERQVLVNEMLGSTQENEPLQAMMKDPFGNYVVQKVLETCDDQSRELILSRIRVHLTALKKYTYGKHIVSRVEKLIATGEKHIALSSNTCRGNPVLKN